MSKIKVVELFAGVGGFRLGLEKASKDYDTIFANQWEPGKNIQHAYNCYVDNFGSEGAVNDDINKIWKTIPKHDLLVGGFPCQDYSVATTKAKGMEGKKGVLWWDIYNIIKKNKPKAVLLENVDRLIKSPAKQRGRDFAIILYLLNKLGYAVEWKSFNAAEYGMPQKRRRVFIFAYKTKAKKMYDLTKLKAFKSFESEMHKNRENEIDLFEQFKDVQELSDNFDGRWWNTGLAMGGKVHSEDHASKYTGPIAKMEDFIDHESDKIYLTKVQQDKMEELKGKKVKVRRVGDFEYKWTEGQMQYPETLDRPFRTILTSETGISRSTHSILDDGKIRFLTPIEAERANCFPDNWTKILTNKQRFFVMGNALVVDIVERIGKDIKGLL